MKTPHRAKQFATHRVQCSAESKRAAADQFRQRALDRTLARALKATADRKATS